MYEQGIDFDTGEMHQNLRAISSERLGNQRSGAISPSGDYLAFVSEIPGDALLHITNLVSGDTKVHDFVEFSRIQMRRFQALTWSSDNTSVLFTTVDSNVQPARLMFLSVNVQDGSFVELDDFDDINVRGPGSLKGIGYSPDGKKVIFATLTHLVEMNIKSKLQRVIHEFSDGTMESMSLSPDGQTAAVTWRPWDRTGDNSSIELVSIVDGSISKLNESGEELGYSQWVGISWTPNGKNLVFAENRPNQGQQLYTINLESGKRIAIGEPVFGDDQLMGVRVHPDGDKITFFRGTRQLQLWVLEGIEL